MPRPARSSPSKWRRPGAWAACAKKVWIELERVFVESRVLGEGPHVVRVVRGGVEHEQVVQVEKSVDVRRFAVVLPEGLRGDDDVSVNDRGPAGV